jgi:hypothetical protein
LVSGFQIEFDIGEWINLERAIEGLRNSSPRLIEEYYQTIADELNTRIFNQISLQDINDTGTYSSSIRVEATEDNVFIGFEPTGPEAERLPIYWKTLEFGSGPVPLIPRAKLGDWGFRKLGSRLSGFRAASTIEKFGVKPHPILSRFFILSRPDGNVLGITSETSTIINVAGAELLGGFTQIFQNILTGQISVLLNIPGEKSRFISPKGFI